MYQLARLLGPLNGLRLLTWPDSHAGQRPTRPCCGQGGKEVHIGRRSFLSSLLRLASLLPFAYIAASLPNIAVFADKREDEYLISKALSSEEYGLVARPLLERGLRPRIDLAKTSTQGDIIRVAIPFLTPSEPRKGDEAGIVIYDERIIDGNPHKSAESAVFTLTMDPNESPNIQPLAISVNGRAARRPSSHCPEGTFDCLVCTTDWQCFGNCFANLWVSWCGVDCFLCAWTLGACTLCCTNCAICIAGVTAFCVLYCQSCFIACCSLQPFI
jgi:hypothetical protein